VHILIRALRLTVRTSQHSAAWTSVSTAGAVAASSIHPMSQLDTRQLFSLASKLAPGRSGVMAAWATAMSQLARNDSMKVTALTISSHLLLIRALAHINKHPVEHLGAHWNLLVLRLRPGVAACLLTWDFALHLRLCLSIPAWRLRSYPLFPWIDRRCLSFLGPQGFFGSTSRSGRGDPKGETPLLSANTPGDGSVC